MAARLDRLPDLVAWVACADCNDDGQKPKPPLCPTCDAVPFDCRCQTDATP